MRLGWRIDLKQGTNHINFTNYYAISDIKPTLKFLKKKKGIRVIELSSNDIEDLKSYKLLIQEKLLPIRTDINKVPLIFSLILDYFTELDKKIYYTIVYAKLKHRGFHSLRQIHTSNFLKHTFTYKLLVKDLFIF